MAYAKQEQGISFHPQEKMREYYVYRRALFGIIGWNETVKKDAIGNRLDISIAVMPEEIYINGKLFIHQIHSK